MVQAAAFQGGDGNDDALDVVLLAQGGNLFQRALDRHAVDGLVELGGVIVHRHHRVTVEVVGLADIDGPVAGLARAHDHHRAVGVLVGVAPQPLPQRVVQEEPPCQAAAAHQQKDEDGGHNIGRIEEHAMDEGAVDQIDDDGGHADHPAG